MSVRDQDKEDLLPGVITSISPQKKNKDRYSIFVDENFLIGLSESVLLSFNLEIGTRLNRGDYREIQSAEKKQYVRNYLLNLLSRRDHTRRELMQKASKKQIDQNMVELLLDEFEEKGWIDHDSFTQSFIKDKFRLNHWGPRKIIASLQQKGISRQRAEEKTEQYFESIDLLDIFQRLVDKKSYKFSRIENRYKRRKKVFDYLSRKGYHSQQILSHLDRLMEDLKP